MSSGLLIVGAGGHGRVVADTAERSGKWSNIAFIDDIYPGIQQSGNWPVIGGLEDLPDLSQQWTSLVVAIGRNQLRLDITKKCQKMGYHLANIIHPSAEISEHARLGFGNVIFANTVVNTGAVLKNACIINTGATVDHDCSLADAVHLSPGVNLGGTVAIGPYSWVGIGATVINNVSVGSGVIVGAGAVVINDIPDNVTAVGIPAKTIVSKS
jgi:sugar O-acyltransferase (sialic acid O-acetyltransferase NeuD family)